MSDVKEFAGKPDNETNYNTQEQWDGLYSKHLSGKMGSGFELYNAVADDIEDGLEVLDLGGGEGNEVQVLLSRLPNSRVTTVEISSVAVEAGRNKYDNIEFICADFNDFTTDKKYDVAVASQFLEHFDNPQKTVEKMMSMLKDGGSLYIGLPHEDMQYQYHQHRWSHDSYHFFRRFSRWVSFSDLNIIKGTVAKGGYNQKHMYVRLIKDSKMERTRRFSQEYGMIPVAIYYTWTPKKIHAKILEEEGLGGTETTALLLAKEMARKNLGNRPKYQVFVFGNVDTHRDEGTRIEFVNEEEFEKYGGFLDTVIITGSGRHQRKVASGIFDKIPNIILWLHSAGVDGDSPEVISYTYEKADTIMYQSNWHRDIYYGEMARVNSYDMGQHRDKEVITTGFFPEELRQFIPLEGRNPVMIYASQPVRGLAAFKRILPRLKERCPDLMVHSHSSFGVYVDGPQSPSEAKLLAELSEHPNFVDMGIVPYTLLVDEIAHAFAVAYPSSFWETMCNVAIMSMRSGTPVVTSSHSALMEVNHDGPFLVDTGGRSSRELIDYVMSDEYADIFVDRVAELYSSSARWNAESKRCVEVSADYSISRCAEKLYARM